MSPSQPRFAKAATAEWKQRLRPIYLLADSQPLFFQPSHRQSLLREVVNMLPGSRRFAAYIGASNGDDPRFFSIFESALDAVDLVDRRLVRTDFSEADAAFLRCAGLILLAGGDVARGWDVMLRTGMYESIVRQFHEGAILMGVSAGAVQLGFGGKHIADAPDDLRTFGLVEYWIDVHDEANRWSRLRNYLPTCGNGATGLGIPIGAAVIYHPDRTIEAVRRPVSKFVASASGLRETFVSAIRM